jgi:hypothetical protein
MIRSDLIYFTCNSTPGISSAEAWKMLCVRVIFPRIFPMSLINPICQ